MSLLEAMAYGRACVTSDIPECADVLGNTGVTFPRGDASALGRVLEELLATPAKIRRLGIKATARVEDNFGWSLVVEKTLALYEGLENEDFACK